MSAVIEIALSDSPARLVRSGPRRIVFLDDDAAHLHSLRQLVGRDRRVDDLAGRFDALYDRLQGPLVRALTEVGRRLPGHIWWTGQVASRSSTATKLMRNVIYLHAAAEMIDQSGDGDMLFLCADLGLARALVALCRKRGLPCRLRISPARRIALAVGGLLRLPLNLALTLRDFMAFRRWRGLLPPPKSLGEKRRRAVIRTWVTAGAFDGEGRYVDRHFGPLPDFLRRHGFDVLVVPMFFNLGRSLKEQFALMARSGQEFLVPQHHLGYGSLLRLLAEELRRLCFCFHRVDVEGLDVAPILKHENRKDVLNPSLLRLNLIRPLLEKLRRRGVEIELLLYPFENNAPEKQFLMAKRRWYPESTIIACQHSVWLSRQAGAELIPEEVATHPLADRIVVCGRVYLDLLARLGFPKDRLRPGPSLRFAQVRDYQFVPRNRSEGRPPRIFLALPFCRNTSLDMLDKLRRAIGDDFKCRVLLKSHPLLPADELKSCLEALAFQSLEVVDGPPIEWFGKCDVAVAAGTSVTQMEAVACGLPLVRVVPDNTFFLDPMKWMDYPLQPATTADQLRARLEEALLMTDGQLAQLAETVRKDYFEAVTEQTMSVFLETKN